MPLLRNDRCPHGLRLLLLPVPHADGDRGPESLRSAGAAADLTLPSSRALRPGCPEAPGRRPCHPNWSAQPRPPPHPAPHRTATGRGLPPDPRRPLLRWRRLLLLLPGQGRENRSPGTATARSRGAQSRATGTGDLDLEVMGLSESLWGVTSGTFYAQLQRHFRDAGLPPAGIHILRHTAAKLRRDAGESIEDVSRFLDHTSLAVTTTYLRRLEGQEDHGWGRVAEAIGVGLEGALVLATCPVRPGSHHHFGCGTGRALNLPDSSGDCQLL